MGTSLCEFDLSAKTQPGLRQGCATPSGRVKGAARRHSPSVARGWCSVQFRVESVALHFQFVAPLAHCDCTHSLASVKRQRPPVVLAASTSDTEVTPLSRKGNHPPSAASGLPSRRRSRVLRQLDRFVLQHVVAHWLDQHQVGLVLDGFRHLRVSGGHDHGHCSQPPVGPDLP